MNAVAKRSGVRDRVDVQAYLDGAALHAVHAAYGAADTVGTRTG